MRQFACSPRLVRPSSFLDYKAAASTHSPTFLSKVGQKGVTQRLRTGPVAGHWAMWHPTDFSFFLFFFLLLFPKSPTCVYSFVWSDTAATANCPVAFFFFLRGYALDQLHFSLERGVGGMFIYLRVGKCSRQHILFQDSCIVHLQIPGSPIKTYPLPQGTAWQALLTRQHWQLFGSFWSGSNLVWVCYTFILSTSSKQISESRIPSCVLQWKCFNVWELLLLQGRYRVLLTV